MHVKTYKHNHKFPLALPKFHPRKPSLRVHLPGSKFIHSLRRRPFVREYSLPIAVTFILIILVSGVAGARFLERSSLADLLPGITIGGKDYGSLLSRDKADEFKKNEDNGADARQAGATSSGSSVALNSGSTSANTTTGGAGTTGGGGNAGGGGGTTTPAFSSQVQSLQQSSVTTECGAGVPRKNKCSKRYVFSAGVKTFNGPGSVSYSWQSSLSSANESSGFSAGSGENLTTLQKTIVLDCKTSSSLTLKLAVSSPTSGSSNTLTLNHNCNEILL